MSLRKAVTAGRASPKTTIAGILLLVTPLVAALTALTDDDPTTVADWNAVVTGVVAAIAFFFARDADKSSQDSKIK